MKQALISSRSPICRYLMQKLLEVVRQSSATSNSFFVELMKVTVQTSSATPDLLLIQ